MRADLDHEATAVARPTIVNPTAPVTAVTLACYTSSRDDVVRDEQAPAIVGAPRQANRWQADHRCQETAR